MHTRDDATSISSSLLLGLGGVRAKVRVRARVRARIGV